MTSLIYKDHRFYIHSYSAVDAPGRFIGVAFIRGPSIQETMPEMVHPDERCSTRRDAEALAAAVAKAWVDGRSTGLASATE
jgi:hypothetical protein